MKSRYTLLLSLLSAWLPTAAGAATLGLDAYLDEVAQSSPGMAATRLSSEGARLRSEGAEVLTFPYLFGNWTSLDDRAPPAFPAMQGTQTQANSYTLGVGVNTTVGLNAKYSFNSAWGNIVGLAPYRHYTAYNKIELTQSLVRNGFGSQLRAQSELSRSGALAQSLAAEYSNAAQLVGAEATYWRLAVAREAVSIQRDVLARADRLLQWAKRRVSLQLGDQSDLLQAQAAYEAHQLELSLAQQEEASAARAFNTLRRQSGDRVPETLALPSLEQTLALKAPERQGERLDVRAAEQQSKAVQAQAQIEKENYKPTVDLVAAYAWNGRNNSRSEARADAFRSDLPTKSIGVNFVVPLDVPTWNNVIHGANRQIEAASYDLEQKRLDESRDWSDLTSKYADVRRRLEMARSLERVQREKYENERQRLLRGRTTTYQAVTFEQDYASSQLMRLRTQAELLQILAQMKLYRGEQ